MRTLHVSLGHNASAILTEDGKVVRGYEQERLDRRKGSSYFPAAAISEAMRDGPADNCVISSWIDNLDPLRTEHKHYSAAFMLSRFAPKNIQYTRSGGVTHHDAHAISVRNFFTAHATDVTRPYVTIVCDGFGNGQECLSVYRNGGLIHRTYGYEMSLGLMYQYTTGYLGMKENEDEYKLLGYEAHAPNVIGRVRTQALYDAAHDEGHTFGLLMLRANERVLSHLRGEEIDLDALAHAKRLWLQRAEAWRAAVETTSEYVTRCVVALQAQSFLEGAMQAIVHAMVGEDDDLLLAGGVFYNVKLNNRILNMRQLGRVCVHPLSGDQGAALGLSSIHHSGLLWGERSIEPPGELAGRVLVMDQDVWGVRVADIIEMGDVVNVVRGAAEYGPRALCNTTTFAQPTPRMVSRINLLNDRNDVMPMAPVIREDMAEEYFFRREYERVVGSSHYMVMTHEIRHQDFPLGVTHPDPLNPFRRTARPQIVPTGNDPQLEALLENVNSPCLINTSYNFHGEPIVHSVRDAIATHARQCERAVANGVPVPYLVLVRS
jgi:predicted NodU family carbamoyl transferase